MTLYMVLVIRNRSKGPVMHEASGHGHDEILSYVSNAAVEMP